MLVKALLMSAASVVIPAVAASAMSHHQRIFDQILTLFTRNQVLNSIEKSHCTNPHRNAPSVDLSLQAWETAQNRAASDVSPPANDELTCEFNLRLETISLCIP